jgi:hypothetical protein
MVQVKDIVRRAGSNLVLYVYIDHAVRAMRRARMTRAAVVDRPFSRQCSKSGFHTFVLLADIAAT